MKVYLVTSGSYSDYSVEAVFSDKALAEAHRLEIDGNEVEEYELLTEAPTRFMVYNKSNHTYHGPTPHEWSYPAWSFDRGLYSRAKVEETKYTNGRTVIRVTGWDQEAVRKAFDDRHAAMEASKAGIA